MTCLLSKCNLEANWRTTEVKGCSDSVGVHVVKLGDKLTEQVHTVKYLGASLVVI